MIDKIAIGSHVSMSGPDYYLGSVKEALSYNANAFMFYTGAPQNLFRLPTSKLKIAEANELLDKINFDRNNIIVHAPYIINIANKTNEALYNSSIENIINELKRTADFGLSTLVLHPGSHVGTGVENGLDSIIKALNDIFSRDGTNVKIALETMAGKGGEMGANFEQLHYIISHVENKNRIGVCFDTCHVNDEGIEINDIDKVLNDFDEIIGLNYLLCLHINDSKNPRGSHKDRHENIGYGEIGFETISKYVHHPKLVNIPKILETPYFNGKSPYKKEIEMLKNNTYIENWRDSL